MTPKELLTKYCFNLPAMQRKANLDFFNMVAKVTTDGGYWTWPDQGKVFQIRNGCFFEVQ